MADPSAWRFSCCNRLANALADERGASLSIGVIPIRRKGIGGRVLTVSATVGGRIVASCRHEVTSNNGLQWLEEVTKHLALSLIL